MTIPTPTAELTALVTGASSGIGAEIARHLAARGYGVTLVARSEDKLRTLALELGTSVRAEVIAADLALESERADLAAKIDALGLKVAILVNNAGISTAGAVRLGAPGRDVTMIRLNAEAVADMTSIFLPGIVALGGGAVLNVASTAAFQPTPGQAGYGATKAFVLSYSHAVRAELRGTGVSVTTLCPGPVHTGFGEAAGITDAEAQVLPKIMWLEAEEVAKQAVAGMFAGKAVVVPGLANKVLAGFADASPRGLLARLVASQHPSLKTSLKKGDGKH